MAQPLTTATTKHIWLITGPAGCGKSTVAQYLAKELSLPYVEGDDWHSPENKAKMAAGTALTDGDRWDWLITLREEALHQLQISTTSTSVVVTCSALKRKYRDVFRIANYHDPSIKVHFVYLAVDEATLQKRVEERVGHYMKADMVHSQMTTLEQPDASEKDVLAVDVRDDKEAVQSTALEMVRRR